MSDFGLVREANANTFLAAAKAYSGTLPPYSWRYIWTCHCFRKRSQQLIAATVLLPRDCRALLSRAAAASRRTEGKQPQQTLSLASASVCFFQYATSAYESSSNN